jgi:fumarylpyruvate hydrolase
MRTPHQVVATVAAVAGSDAGFPVRRVYCVGRNYADHAREMGSSGREAPFFFAKPADAVVAVAASDEGRVPYPPRTANLHHEVELVVAIGRAGSDIAVADACRHVFGYAVGVDLTRRDLQADLKQKGQPWEMAKAFDHSAPMGPIRVADACDHPAAGTIALTVNGVERQRGDLNDMIWSVPEVIAELSTYVELRPGDLIFTGTPAGVGPLERGDRVVADIDDLDRLAFSIA